MTAISEPLLYGRNGAKEARIRRGDEANLLPSIISRSAATLPAVSVQPSSRMRCTNAAVHWLQLEGVLGQRFRRGSAGTPALLRRSIARRERPLIPPLPTLSPPMVPVPVSVPQPRAQSTGMNLQHGGTN
jgi:hypothetical protein